MALPKEKTIGQEVYIDGDGGFCHPSWEKITDIETRYDEETGKPYQLIKCKDHHFNGTTGECMKGASAYYINNFVTDNK